MKLNLLSKCLTVLATGFILAVGSGGLMAQTNTILTGSGTFTVPCGVTSVKIRAIGGGGAGGYRGNASIGTGGGGGGAYSEITVPVTTNKVFNYAAGVGGNGGQNATVRSGVASTVTFDNTIILKANGGMVGSDEGPAGAGGSTVGAVGTTQYSGGSGSAGTGGQGKHSGAGGGAGSSVGNGKPPVGLTGGLGGGTYGGNGGGAVAGSAGNSGFDYGGGGSGILGSSGISGNGASGVVVFTYTYNSPVITLPATNPVVCANQPFTFTLPASNVSDINTVGLPQGISADLANNVITISGTTASTGTFNYTITANNCSTTTFSGAITVNSPAVITAGPAATSAYCVGSTATALSVSASGTAPLTYQWYRNAANDNTSGTAIPAATANSYIPPTSVQGTVYYYVKVTGCNTATSATATVNVGTANTWNGANWSEGSGSSSKPGYNVVINGNYNTTNGNILACNCTVNSGANLTIGANSSATIENNIINNGMITLTSGGNLLQTNPAKNTYSGTGAFKVESPNMRLENGAVNMDYVYWSSPVAGQNIAAFSPGTPTRNLLQYTEKTDYFATTPDVVFKPAKGYALRAETTGVATGVYTKTYVFTGAPNNGFFGAAVTKTGNGYNLVGNPYPSAINFDILQANNAALIDGILYRWNNKVDTPPVQQGSAYNQSNYVTYSSLGGENPSLSGNIAVGMGFIVRSKASGTLNFENTYTGGQQLRGATAATFYKKEISDKNRFWLALTSPENLYKTQLIGYVDGASDGRDSDYDAAVLSMGPNQFYSVLGDDKLVIQGKSSDFKVSDKIMLGAKIASKGQYSISVLQPEGIFSSTQKIYLKDHQLNTITDLSAESYTFMGEVGPSENRFEIVYQAAALSTDNVAKDGLVVYKDGNIFFVKGGKKIKTAEVFDASGRLVKMAAASGDNLEIPAESFVSGFYVLIVKYDDGAVKTKKILK
ncbi:T9SS type A sorting domain-containing protein [Kaistella daneshvariae]